MGKAIHLMSLDNQGDFELFVTTGRNQIRFKELFGCGVVVLCSGLGLSKLQTWGYLGSVACVLFFLNAGLNVLPQVFWMALVAVVLLVALLLPGNFFVIRGLYQDVTSRTSGIKYRVRVWGGAILGMLLLALVFWVSE